MFLRDRLRSATDAEPRQIARWVADLDSGTFAVRERGLRCLVVHAPFVHHGGGTRAQAFARDPEHERRDIVLRKVAIDRLLHKWGHRLPADVRPLGARVEDWVRDKLTRRTVTGDR